eukprot:scaffold2188_cov81-Skeletonema_menzelii.AAC.1
MKNRRDYSYYEAHAADVNLDEITSSYKNKQILQRLRDGKIKSIEVGRDDWYSTYFCFSKGDDLRWLGYFIGRNEALQKLTIDGLHKDEDEGREQRMVHALSGAIARSRSIQEVSVLNLSNDGFAALAGALVNLNLTQLERFYYYSSRYSSNDPINYCATLGNLLESGVWNLKELSLPHSNIGDAGVAALAHGFRSIESSLKELNLSENSIGSEGLSTLVAALANCTNIKRLELNGNDFSMAAAGLRSLSDWLQTAALTLDKLCLRNCDITDEGLQVLAEGEMDNCKGIDLSENRNITASGWRCLSTSLQSERCRLEELVLGGDFDDDFAEVFACSLVGNKSLKHLRMDYYSGWISITLAGWSAFSK